MVRTILRIEGIIVFLSALFIFDLTEGNWIYFIGGIFLVDLSMIGYVKNEKLGAILYNAAHNYIFALLVGVIGLVLESTLLTHTGLIISAHIGIDRALGYGLKYQSGFKHTHMQRV